MRREKGEGGCKCGKEEETECREKKRRERERERESLQLLTEHCDDNIRVEINDY